MSSELNGFLTGFMTSTADNINKRKDEASKYFTDRMEMARTVGMENRAKRQQEMNDSLTVAKQLLQSGVPKDVVMGIANQNPDDLPTFYDTITKLQTEGVETTPELFREIAQIGGNFKAPDEDLGTFFERIFTPLANNAKADPDSFKNDPKGSVWATLMGHNAMDRAQQKLDTTKVIGDQTASDVLAYGGSNERSKPYGDSTVTLNYGVMGDKIREAKDSFKEDKPLTPTEIATMNKQFDEIAAEEYMAVKDAATKQGLSVPNGPWNKSPYMGQVLKAASERMQTEFGYAEADLAQLPRVASPENFTDTTTETAPPIQEAAPEETPEIVDLPPDFPTQIGAFTFVKNNGDGTSLWRKEGETVNKMFKNKDLLIRMQK